MAFRRASSFHEELGRPLSATVKNIAPTQVELEIEVSVDEMAAARERAFRKLAKDARVPGFRPGKVPRKIFEQQYGTEIIGERAMDEVVPEAYTRALKEHNLDPVDRPQMELMPSEDGEPLKFRATVYVRPEISLGEYKGIELNADPVVVSDEDVARSLSTLANRSATQKTVERPAQIGDFVVMDYRGTIDGIAFEGGEAENQTTELLEDRFIPGFAAGIAGMKAGDSKEVEANFPDEYSVSELAGKKAVFAIKLQEVKESEAPQLDDEFAKNVSNSETLEDLRLDIRRRLEAAGAANARKALSNQVVDKLLEAHDFPLPDVLVEREIDNLIGDSKAYVARFGQDWNEYMKSRDTSEDKLREEYLVEAQRRVKTVLLLEAIAKAEKIEVTTADVDAELNSLSRQYGQPKDAILQMLRPNLSSLIEGILRSKTLDFLVESAKMDTPAALPASI